MIATSFMTSVPVGGATAWPPRMSDMDVARPRLFTHWRPSLDDGRVYGEEAVIRRPAGSRTRSSSISAGSESSTVYYDACSSPSWSSRASTPDPCPSTSPSSSSASSTPRSQTSTSPFSAYAVHEQRLFGRTPAWDDEPSFSEYYAMHQNENGSMISRAQRETIWGDAYMPDVHHSTQMLLARSLPALRKPSTLPDWDVITYLRD
ncbi:hypothetical protein FA95DRAFT_1679371 [Auriscalpium vulgare]|uniref:Uncharacterized protein n=1 Tax=Auriscalpium vulgare TaxID=40419 RepID=A0ACB8RSF3_9AGAM|nr:hypothetical protein FA95DRAFT_1679371 [Auriscalpium vulgare]